MPARKTRIPAKTAAQTLEASLHHLISKLAAAQAIADLWAVVLVGLQELLIRKMDAPARKKLLSFHTFVDLQQTKQLAEFDRIQNQIIKVFADQTALLAEFQEGQWWVKELDDMTVTSEQMRAMAVVHNLLKKIPR